MLTVPGSERERSMISPTAAAAAAAAAPRELKKALPPAGERR
jgi:hypothetical protein